MNGRFRACAQAMQREFPGLPIEGGGYTPPATVQYAIRATRVAEVLAGLTWFFGEQAFASAGRRPPAWLVQVWGNPLLAAGGIYGIDVIAQTLNSINAFEVTYNGELLHSKLNSGSFPEPAELVQRLAAVKRKEAESTQAGGQPQGQN